MTKDTDVSLRFRPLDATRWDDLVSLFGPRGACGGCWCMVWRLRRKEFDAGKGDTNRDAFRALVESGERPGVLAYDATRAVGWVAVAPREAYPALARSRILKPLDDTPVWSVSCLFVAKDHRHKGVSVALLRAAAEFAATRGARVLEGYPVEPATTPAPAAFVWTGLAAAFRDAGFQECARPSPTRPIMRLRLDRNRVNR